MLGERLIKAQSIADKVFKYYNFDNYPYTESEIDRLKGVYRKTKVPCSCRMCMNRRKFEGLTMAEKRRIHPDFIGD